MEDDEQAAITVYVQMNTPSGIILNNKTTMSYEEHTSDQILQRLSKIICPTHEIEHFCKHLNMYTTSVANS